MPGKLESFDGTSWVVSGDGTVKSVNIVGSTGLTVTGVPITSSGTINLILAADLQALSSITFTGFMARTGPNAYLARTITAGVGISISDGNGILGNPTISLENPIVTSSSSYRFSINNTNISANNTAFSLQENGVTVTDFGYNNSTNESYIWNYTASSIKFGTNNIKRMELLSNGTLDLLTNNLITTGNISAGTGQLMSNQLIAYSSSEIAVSSNFNMQNKHVFGLPLTPFNSSSAISKGYIDNFLDNYQTLPYSSAINWDATLGNTAFLTLSGNTIISNISGWNQRSTLTLFVKQDATGGRVLNIYNIYRSGSTSSVMPLSSAANALDCLIFKWSGIGSILYLAQVINNFQAVTAPLYKNTYDYTGVQASQFILASATNRCRLKVLGAGGGQGVYNGGGSSGAGGYTIFEFNTTNYLGQILYIRVGQGGEGGTSGVKAGTSGWPDGGWGISGDTYPGAGGGRSEVRIGSSNGTILAIAGGGGGGSGYSTNGLGAGGGSTGDDGVQTGSGGTQFSGGISASSPYPQPTQFAQSGFLSAAGATTTLTNESYDCGGGGGGYYGGGCSGGDGKTSGGGSGYDNTSFPGRLGTVVVPDSSGISISASASSDPDFSSLIYGVGRNGVSLGTNGIRGGNGRVVIELY